MKWKWKLFNFSKQKLALLEPKSSIFLSDNQRTRIAAQTHFNEAIQVFGERWMHDLVVESMKEFVISINMLLPNIGLDIAN